MAKSRIDNLGVNKGSNGLDKNPANINRKGPLRIPSINNAVKTVAGGNGVIFIGNNLITERTGDGVYIQLASDEALAVKMFQIALEGNDRDSLRAIAKIKESLESETLPTTPVNNTIEIGVNSSTIERIEALKEIRKKINADIRRLQSAVRMDNADSNSKPSKK